MSDEEKIEQDVIDEVEDEIPTTDEETMPEVKGFTPLWNPLGNVSIVTEILETRETAHKGAVGIPNESAEELNSLLEILSEQIGRAQFKRRELTAEEINRDYTVIEKAKLIITHQEAEVYEMLSNSLSMLSNSPTVDSLKHGTWTNLLVHGDRNSATSNITKHKDPVRDIQARLGLRNEIRSTLYHSGLQVEVVSPGALDDSFLLDRLADARADNSRETYGYSLESTDVYTNEILIDFFFDHLVNTNLGSISKSVFEENLSVLDIDTCIMNMAASIYRNGFEVFRQCNSTKATGAPCGELSSYLMNIRRMTIPQDSCFSDKQKVLLTRTKSKIDISALTEYRESLRPELSRYVEIGEDLYIKLRVPSYADYKRISKAWMEKVLDTARKLLTYGTDGSSPRQRYIAASHDRARVMMLAHWVEAICSKDEAGEYQTLLTRVIDKSTASIEDIREADSKVDEVLENLSNNAEAQELAVEGINNFITRFNCVLHVLPKSKCPKCGEPHPVEGKTVDPDLIVIDPTQLFFTALLLRTQGVQ